MAINFKTVLYGEFGVGKTALVHRLYTNEFADSTHSTIGASFINWKPQVDGKKVLVGVWDTAGQERFHSLLPLYLRGSHAVLLCCDYNTPIDYAWLENMYNTAKYHSSNCLFYIIFTKIDLSSDVVIKCAKAEEFAESVSAKVAYTSSFTGNGVKEIFDIILNDLLSMPKPALPDILQLERQKPIKRDNYCC